MKEEQTLLGKIGFLQELRMPNLEVSIVRSFNSLPHKLNLLVAFCVFIGAISLYLSFKDELSCLLCCKLAIVPFYNSFVKFFSQKLYLF